ncbi:Myomegalin [Larimichthys crocea]|uniref:Uncharacterized protein n=1 Tax=Larimichthys crocea TaxID=215358 RepID=A0ACD3RN16_LARCR|nr:Myomegalin [Larimichthys crocea]
MRVLQVSVSVSYRGLRTRSTRSSPRSERVSGAESVRGQGEVLALQASLFQAQLELQAGQRSQRQAARTQEDLNRALQRLDKDLQGALQHRRETERHNQRAVDEKFRCVEEKEEETRRLQLLLREKERDLERQRCVLTNNEETITVLVRGKGLELEQVCDAWRNVQRQQQDSEDRHSRSMRERDDIISQLQAALSARTQEAQDLRCSLLAQIQSAPSDVLEELKVRLQLKDRLFQEVLADRTHQVQEHQEQVQDLLRTISCRDQVHSGLCEPPR